MKKAFLLFLTALSGNFFHVAAQCQFNYTGSVQLWTVPYGVTSIDVDVVGAAGGQMGPYTSVPLVGVTTPGKGGRVQATIPVTSGQVLRIYVGGVGKQGTAAGTTGGWNGGGSSAGHLSAYSGGGGGGASDIRSGAGALTDRLVVGSGGGGAAFDGSCPVGDQPGGDGGGLTGSAVTSCTATLIGIGYSPTYATGGTQLAGGTGGALPGPFAYTSGNNGALGIGGDAPAVGDPGISGGGGGGYYGGGAGCWTGGAGGSSYATASATGVTHTAGYQSGDGVVTITLKTPTKIYGATSLCTGLSLTLSSDAAGGLWTSSNTSVATVDVDSGIVRGVNPGLVTITYAQRCSAAKLYVNINVIASPAPINGPDPVCVGSTVTYTDATPGGGWSISSTASASFTSPTATLTGLYPGSATLTYSDPTAGCYTTRTVLIHGISGPKDVCAGQTITLNASEPGGTWSSTKVSIATVGISGIVSGISIGTATISYTGAICPTAHVVYVSPIAPNVGPDSICLHASDFVTNVVGGGIWSSSDASVIKVVAGTGLINAISVGSATVTYITSAGCVSKNVISVLPAPPGINGYKQVCPGNTITLTDTATWGAWSSTNTTVATINPVTGVLTGITADTVTILYTVRPGCAAAATVIVNPIPYPISGPDTLCPGVADTVSSASFGGRWTTSTPLLDTIVDSTGRVTAKFMGGIAVVTYTLPTGCSRSKNIYVRNVPLPAITYDWPTQTFHAPTGYEHYQWYDSVTGKIPKANSPTLAAVYYEWYYVVVTDANGCQSKSPLYYFESTILNVRNTEGSHIRLYPNPARDIVNIESDINVRVVITSLDGKVVIDQPEAKQLNISALASAAYMVSLYDDSGQLVSVQKMIKN